MPKPRVIRVLKPRNTHPLGNMLGFILSPQVKTCRRCGGK